MTIQPLTLKIKFGGTWQNVSVSSYVMDIRISMGRRRYLDDLPVGSASFRLRNDTDAFHPLNTSGPFYASGTGFDVGVPIEVWVNRPNGYGAQSRLWVGKTKSWTVDVTKDPQRSTATLDAVDLVEDFYTRNFSGSFSSMDWLLVRLTAIGALVTGAYDIDMPSSAYTSLPVRAIQYENRTAIELLREQASSCFTSVWVTHEFTQRFRVLAPGAVPAASSSYLHFTSNARVSARDIPYHAVSPLTFSPHQYNSVTLSASGAAYTTEDATSIARYGERQFNRSGLLVASNTEIELHAERFLAVHKDPVFCPSWVEVNIAAIENAVWDDLITFNSPVRPGMPCRVTVRGYTFECVIEGIEHSITSTMEWIMRFYLSPRLFYTDPL